MMHCANSFPEQKDGSKNRNTSKLEQNGFPYYFLAFRAFNVDKKPPFSVLSNHVLYVVLALLRMNESVPTKCVCRHRSSYCLYCRGFRTRRPCTSQPTDRHRPARQQKEKTLTTLGRPGFKMLLAVYYLHACVCAIVAQAVKCLHWDPGFMGSSHGSAILTLALLTDQQAYFSSRVLA